MTPDCNLFPEGSLKTVPAVLALVAAAGLAQAQELPPAAPADLPRSKPELTNYQETSTHAEVMAFYGELQKRSNLIRIGAFGKTVEGRDMPLVTLANPPIATAAEARAAGKPIVFVMANIHAGEVEGKEAMQHFARRALFGDLRPLLDNLIILIAPNYNADGNEKFSLMNRTSQNGPIAGVGTRENAQRLDLNRDFIKADAPETRALIALFKEWDPLVTVDLHSTNGSYTHFHVTYSIPLNPMVDAPLADYHRNTLMPALTTAMKARRLDTYYYGNFSVGQNPRASGLTGRGAPASGITTPPVPGMATTAAAATQAALQAATNRAGTATTRPTGWYAFTHQPRIGQNYVGFRNRFAILCEAYTYLNFKGRIDATEAFVEEICRFTVRNGNEMQRLAAAADAAAVRRGNADVPLQLGVEYIPKALPQPVDILVGEVERIRNPRNDRDMTAMLEGRFTTVKMLDYGMFEATRHIPAARVYLFKDEPATQIIREKLQVHGIRTETLAAPMTARVHTFIPQAITLAANPFQGHREAQVKGTYREETIQLPAGTFVVRAAQPLGLLAAYLLEPESDDGLTRWGFLQDAIAEGKPHPIMKITGEFQAELRPAN